MQHTFCLGREAGGEGSSVIFGGAWMRVPVQLDVRRSSHHCMQRSAWAAVLLLMVRDGCLSGGCARLGAIVPDPAPLPLSGPGSSEPCPATQQAGCHSGGPADAIAGPQTAARRELAHRQALREGRGSLVPGLPHTKGQLTHSFCTWRRAACLHSPPLQLLTVSVVLCSRPS